MGSVFPYDRFGRVNADPLRCSAVWSINRFQETNKFVVPDRFLESIQLVPIWGLGEWCQALRERGDRSDSECEGRGSLEKHEEAVSAFGRVGVSPGLAHSEFDSRSLRTYIRQRY